MTNSAIRFVAPIMLAGRTALSVEIITKSSTPYLIAATAVCQSTKDVVFNCRKHMSFHQRNMFIRCRVIDDRRSILFHDTRYLIGLGDISDLRVKRHVWVVLVQLSVNLKQRGLCFVESDQSPRAEMGNLSAEFRADRARSTRHQDNFSLDSLPDMTQIQLYGLTAQKIFNCNIADLSAQFLALDQISETRNHLVLDARIRGQFQNADHLRSGCGKGSRLTLS